MRPAAGRVSITRAASSSIAVRSSGSRKAKLDDDKAILLPTGPGRLYEEYFAPANYTETVNTVALPYYAKREPMKFGKGYDLEMQSNPLPLVLRPDLVATLTA